MRGLILNTLSILQSFGIDYGDCRIVRRMLREFAVKNHTPEVIRFRESYGIGIRVMVKGYWGFAASGDLDAKSVKTTARLAVEVARSSAVVPAPARDQFARNRPIQDTYSTSYKIDPFSVSAEDILDILLSANALMYKKSKINIACSFFDALKEEKSFGSTEGALIDQTIVYCGGGISAFAIDKGAVQHRSYPASFRGNFHTAGWEFFESLDLVGNAPRVASEAQQLLKAPPCPAGTKTVILTGDQLALQIHESIGHAIELDRVFGSEVSLAGTSFLSPDKMGSFRYGSPLVNITADATAPGGLGTFAYDDEGVPAQRVPIIKEGIFQGFLTSRSTAPRINQDHSNGAMRADGWQNFPLIRMTNINIEPGVWNFDDLISDTRDGLLLETNKSWSIDDRRVNFQFSTEIAREIKNGKLGRIFKNPIYSGITWDFWRLCDAVCNDKFWSMWGTHNCGKGEPMQTMFVGHGVAPARFNNVTVGSS